MHVDYETHGVCARHISFEIDDGKIHNVHFAGGCRGNLLAISKLIEGADARTIAQILRGNQCLNNETSCADQLAHAIDEALTGNQ